MNDRLIILTGPVRISPARDGVKAAQSAGPTPKKEKNRHEMKSADDAEAQLRLDVMEKLEQVYGKPQPQAIPEDERGPEWDRLRREVGAKLKEVYQRWR